MIMSCKDYMVKDVSIDSDGELRAFWQLICSTNQDPTFSSLSMFINSADNPASIFLSAFTFFLLL